MQRAYIVFFALHCGENKGTQGLVSRNKHLIVMEHA